MVTGKQVAQFTQEKIERLLSMQNVGQQKASLANLRRGVGRAPGEMPELWGELLQEMPEQMLGTAGPSRAEWAVYTALTLFALHQQGYDPAKAPMHNKGQKLGVAAARIVQCELERGNTLEKSAREKAFDRIRRRFNLAATAEEMPKLSYHLRGLIQLMRTAAIPLDYAILASDLYQFQFPEQRSQVRLRWGQDLYRQYNQYNEQRKEESDE